MRIADDEQIKKMIIINFVNICSRRTFDGDSVTRPLLSKTFKKTDKPTAAYVKWAKNCRMIAKY